MSQAKQEIEKLRQAQEELLASEPRRLWQSVEELDLSRDEAHQARGKEFFKTPEEFDCETPDQFSRRSFLKWTSAASALMLTACQRRATDYLVPYVHKPQGFTYGVPNWYASSADNGYGILIKTREGKPIKLEGNPDHPVNQGGLGADTQASLLNLYNPARLSGAVNPKTGEKLNVAEALSKLKAHLQNTKERKGAIRLLTGPVLSPSLRSMIEEFSKKFNALHHVHQDFPRRALLTAHEVGMGVSAAPSFEFDKADVVVSVGADFLGTWGRPVENTKKFSKRRKVHRGESMNRLIVFESLMTNTGVAADQRHAIRPSQEVQLLGAMASELAKSSAIDAALRQELSKYSLAEVAKDLEMKFEDLDDVVQFLKNSRGRSLVVASENGPDALKAQLLCLVINSLLNNYGHTLNLERPQVLGIEEGESFQSLIDDAIANKVEVLLIHGVNPSYSYPAAEAWQEALGKVGTRVILTSEMNETANDSSLALGESHFLESWGDSEIRRGVYTIQQPVIEPLFETRSLGELLNELNTDGQPKDYLKVVQDYWRKNILNSGNFESAWMQQLKAGAYSKAASGRTPSMRTKEIANHLSAGRESSADGYELVLYRSMNVGDGSHADNAFLQELPDPITKVVWDNCLLISPALANELGIRQPKRTAKESEGVRLMFQYPLVEIQSGGKSVVAPAFVQPGLPKNVLGLAVGYGRKSAGMLGTNVGVNAYPLASPEGFSLSGVKIKKTNGTIELAVTQKHFSAIQGRDHDIVQQLSLTEFQKNPASAKGHPHKPISIYSEKEFVYPGHKWGMAIDLTSCTGCQACVVACYTENNVPIVGKEEVIMGRHMAWLRLDLYYSGSEDQPEAVYEPMLCQHCDNAPCETVCPVLATVHSSDGLNEMTYNRCVGTRYCANNCPYKVRRFNWFQYSDKLARKVSVEDPLPMMLNPDVTVRSRGVMEKCTFCVQRIRKTVDDHKSSGKQKFADGSVQTACQQSCPADAITFGDLNDPESDVSVMAAKAQGFKVLEVLNTRPNVTYLPRVRNKGGVA